MSANLEIARRALDVTMRRSYEEALRICSSEVELTTLYDDPGGTEFRGRDGLRQWFDRLDHLWAFMEIRDAEFEERTDGWVLMRLSARLRGRGSRDEFEAELAAAVRVVDGEVNKFGIFPTEADALAMIAAG
jgi:ketosteroid isomerase-like protein